MRPHRLTRTHRGPIVATAMVVAALTLFVTASGSAAVGHSRILVKFASHSTTADRSAAIRAVDGTEVESIPDIGVHVVSVPSTKAATALGRLKHSQNVDFAEPDATAEAADVPNDPSFSLQWAMTKIKAPDAWTTDQGSPSVKVAVLDTGVSLSHPDLQGKVVASKNFSSSSTVDDVNGHGSHVAGIAAAATNNGIGVAGVGYSVDIMDVKVLGDSGSGLYSDMISGITWAADNGANVINLSLGGTMASSALESAVNYAWSKGVVVVAAAGNNASSAPFYPAYYTNVLAVAATTDLDKLASFSDYGDWVDVAAPGISIYSTIPGGYGYMSGTSMASPFVSGLAALLFAQVTDTNGNRLRNDEVRSRIQSTADNVGLTGIGSGRINAYKAVTGLSAPPPPAIPPPANTSPPTVSGTARDGQTLQASTGSWTNSPTSYSYQWQRCDGAGAGCAAVSGAAAAGYMLGSADVGSTLRVLVTATNSAGNASAQSAQSAPVVAVAPANTAPPAVSGSSKPGQTLTSSSGTWTGTAPLTYAYQWLRCDSAGANCAAIGAATSSSYTVAPADVGSTIRSDVTATNAGGQASIASAQTTLVSNLQTLSFTGTLSKNAASLSFPVAVGAGQADATLTFSKSATMTVKLLDAGGNVVAQSTGTASPVKLTVAGLAAGVDKYVVSGTGYKGSIGFTLTVTVPVP